SPARARRALASLHGARVAEWQTQGTQNPPGATPCEFDSRLGHSLLTAKRERPAHPRARGPWRCAEARHRYGVAASAAWAAVSAGSFWAMSATMPATCGVAMDVPPKKK